MINHYDHYIRPNTAVESDAQQAGFTLYTPRTLTARL